MKSRTNKGFTLVEILIVVVILGILAAIVIPQFSEASTEAKLNSLHSNLQTMRSQLSLYKIQHNDNPPTNDSTNTFVLQMTGTTSIAGAISGSDFGPYLQSIPRNPFTNGNSIGTTTAADWVYNSTTGTITAGYGGTTAIAAGGANIDTY